MDDLLNRIGILLNLVAGLMLVPELARRMPLEEIQERLQRITAQFDALRQRVMADFHNEYSMSEPPVVIAILSPVYLLIAIIWASTFGTRVTFLIPTLGSLIYWGLIGALLYYFDAQIWPAVALLGCVDLIVLSMWLVLPKGSTPFAQRSGKVARYLATRKLERAARLLDRVLWPIVALAFGLIAILLTFPGLIAARVIRGLLKGASLLLSHLLARTSQRLDRRGMIRSLVIPVAIFFFIVGNTLQLLATF